MHEHEAHLEQDLQLRSDVIGSAFVESLGTITTLEQKTFATCGFPQLLAKGLDLPGSDQWRNTPQTFVHHGRMITVFIGGLLKGGTATP
jgi:hypothetical protein